MTINPLKNGDWPIFLQALFAQNAGFERCLVEDMVPSPKPDPMQSTWVLAEAAIRHALKKYFRNTAEIDDVCQEVAVAVLLQLQQGRSFRDDSHLIAWSVRRARWRALDRLEEIARNKARGRDFGRLFARRTGSDPAWPVEIQDLFAHLPPQQRYVMEAVFAGQTDEQISRTLKIQPGTVRSLKRHARARMLEESK